MHSNSYPAATSLIALRACCAGAITTLVLTGSAAAGDMVHMVQHGDTLYSLARDYLEDASQWRQLQTLNRVRDPLRLAPGTRLVIPGALMRPQPATAQVLHVSGAVSVNRSPAQVGQQVSEGARIDVTEGGFVTLRLADGTVIRLPSGTAIQLRELRHAPSSGNIQSTIQLEQGRVDAKVTPLPSPKSRFEVRTPLAVGGVRGTTFGVMVDEYGNFVSDVREGAVQVQRLPDKSRLASAYALVRAGEGTRLAANESGPIETTSLLAAPDLSALPAVLEDALIEFTLPSIARATSWQVRIASDTAMNEVQRNGVFSEPLARFAGLEDGTYQLAVRVADERGIPGGESVRAFTINALPQAPLLREPRQGGRVYGTEVELLCTEGSGVTGYSFQLARDARFTEVVTQSDADVAQCAYTAHNLTPGDYHWRVAAVARDAHGQRDIGPYSKPVGFTLALLPPTPLATSINSEDTAGLTVQWGVSPGGPWHHRIQLARDAAFTNLVDDQQLAEPIYQRARPAAGTYYLRVRQIDGSGMEGPWSPTQTLEIAGRILTSDERPLTSSEGQRVQPGMR